MRSLNSPWAGLVPRLFRKRRMCRIRNKNQQAFGFDFEKKEDCNMVKSGIIDSCRVTKQALQNAASVAGILFTAGTVVTDLPREEPDGDDHHHDHDGMDGF